MPQTTPAAELLQELNRLVAALLTLKPLSTPLETQAQAEAAAQKFAVCIATLRQRLEDHQREHPPSKLQKLQQEEAHLRAEVQRQEAAVANFREKSVKWQQQCANLLRQHEQVLALPSRPMRPTEAPDPMSE
ncbi:hypothetical protein WJX74_001205 [Apatococcus lobatus]|uniref:Mediator of RNA polymerase II transcription subunit 28 n=2 Tax=Apatococcus TaxID=904362 RepID=A0AAW1T1G3_9CHLO